MRDVTGRLSASLQDVSPGNHIIMGKFLRCGLPFVCVFVAITGSSRAEDEGKKVASDGRQSAPIPAAEVSPEQDRMLLDHLKQHHQPAVDFVVSQFRKHDLVLLGETHQVAENCRFVATLIEPMYRAGVRTLALEFIRSRFNDDLHKLTTSPKFDEELVKRLFRQGPWATWGFQDYAEIHRAAWQLNHGLPADAPKFRVIGIDSEWSQYEYWFGERDHEEIFLERVARERHMTDIIKTECLERDEKALVHIGRDHTYTKHGIRLAKVLTDEYGSRIKQVALHTAWPCRDGRAPITGVLEGLAVRAGGGQPIGFEIIESPLARLNDRTFIHWERLPEATLADFAQSYVFLEPVDELHGMTWIHGFISEENFEQARAIALKARWVQEEEAETPDGLDRALQRKFRGELRGK